MSAGQVNCWRGWRALLVAGGLFSVQIAHAADGLEFRRRTEQTFEEARTQFAARPDDFAAAQRLAHASFEWADYATNSSQRAAVSGVGIAASRAAIALAPTNVAGHHRLAQNRGQLARARPLQALGLVKEMEADFLKARSLDPQFEHGGPDRSLGRLYQQAPGWPASIGSKAKARSHLEQAVKLAPDYPGNRLALAEALAEWKEWPALEDELKALTDLLPAARKRLTGEDWESSWAEWDRRLAVLQEQVKAQHSRQKATDPPQGPGP